MPKLTIFPNSSSNTPEEQLKDVNLALQGIDEWGKRITNEVALRNVDDTAQSTTTSNYAAIPEYTNVFNSMTYVLYIISFLRRQGYQR